MHISASQSHTTGFTLVEVMVAVSIFAIIVTVGIGALLNMNFAYSNTRTQQQIMDQLNFVMETMAREIRTGNTYYCRPDNYMHQTVPRNCSSIQGAASFSFTNTDINGNERDLVYRLAHGAVEQKIENIGSGQFTALTPNEVTVEKLLFRVLGAEPGDNAQPLVVITMQGYSTVRQQTTDFALQTSISQRQPDL